jgi:hypothetical protein
MTAVDPFFGAVIIGVLVVVVVRIALLLRARKIVAERGELAEESDKRDRLGWHSWLRSRPLSRWEIIAWTVVFVLIAVVLPAIRP